MELGQRLRQARLDAGLSQKQLCGEKITRNMLSQIENGSARPSMDTLQYLAAQLEKPISFFLEEHPVISPNQLLMEQARNATGQEILDILAKYKSPDPLFDRERWLLEALACLELAEKALVSGKKEYAGTLLERAKTAGYNTPYYTKENEMRRQLLAFEAGFLPAEEVVANERALLLWAQAALEQGEPKRASFLLQAAKEHPSKYHYLLGLAYLELCEYAQAAAHLRQAEDYNPQQVYRALEKCYQAQEDYKMAYFYACKQR